MNAGHISAFTLVEVRIFKYLARIMEAIMTGNCLLNPEHAGQFLASGQILAFYDGEKLLGGGVFS